MRQNQDKLCGKKLHAMTPENTYLHPTKAPVCKACRREADAARRRRAGIPKRNPPQPKPSRVSKRNIGPEGFRARLKTQPDGCILWTGPATATGYGQVSIYGRNWMAHRYAWFLAYGEEPPKWPESGLVLDHTCSNRLCVNVEHLQVITHEENMRKPRGKRKREIRHCKCCPNHPSNQQQ